MDFILQVWDPGSARSIARKAGYCQVCAGMLCTPEGLKALDTLPGYRHHSMHQILQSVKQGCQLCEIILRQGWENPAYLKPLSEETRNKPVWFVTRGARVLTPCSLDRYTARDWENRVREGVGDRMWLDGGQVTLEKPPKVSEETWIWKSRISIAIMASFDDPAAKYFFHRPMQTSFLDGDIMQEAKKWLDDCVGGCHERCVPAVESQLPTRVLDVEPGLGPIVRLQDKMAGKDGRYAALSYCWGGPQPLTATKSNLQTLISGVEVDKLPQTLQDAVHVTRRLGIRYLWIDALCIIQDSPEDKLSEIGKMGTIYRNAVVTIASAYARKASDGFLKVSMDCKLENSCVIPVHIPEHPRVGRVTLATRRPQYELYPDALRTRGWAFQEAVLSRRILIFSRYDLQCHCKPQHNKFLNVGNINRDKTSKLYAFGTKHFDMFDARHKSHGDGWMSALFLGGMWNDMVGEFTSRSLTVADDRLHALQGIANELLQSKHLATNIDRTYVAGIWMACLPSQLVWSRDNRTPLCPDNGNLPFRPITSRSKRAPTWSWACLECPVMFLSVEMVTEQPYRGFSLLHVSSGPGDVQLGTECDILCRSLDEFRHDSTKSAHDIQITLDLDVDELPATVTSVHYILLDKHVNTVGIDEGGPLWLYYVSGIVTYETDEGDFRRLGCFRWDIDQPTEDEYIFGQRRRVKLV
ncbi:hypothetical protein CDV31_005554 [Fusarium ambrosium]|uniref:Heterokaryon incompatibility domain-containing protein n=1 Tax=Fusarium ambrosium TaxID=131363 RepID=A0A428UIN1_9HYPO|nr:hypothetical protein CDV31_005554 [Fusarium ambrosium]